MIKIDNQKSNSGFSVVALLLTVIFVGFVAYGLISIVHAVRQDLRNEERKDTLLRLKQAVEAYKNSYGSYPATAGRWFSSSLADGASNNGGQWIPGLAPGFVDFLPKERLEENDHTEDICGSWKPSYLYKSDSRNYIILAHCSPEGSWGSDDEFYDPYRPTWAWRVCSGSFDVRTGSWQGGCAF